MRNEMADSDRSHSIFMRHKFLHAFYFLLASVFFFSPHFFPGLRRLYIVFLAVVAGSSLNVLDWNYKIISCHNRTNPLFIRVCIRFVNSLLCRRLCVIMFSTESETMQEH